MAVRKCGDGWYFRHQAPELNTAYRGIENVLGFRIERRECRYGRDKHPHRMRLVVEAIHEFLNVFVKDRMVRDVMGPFVEFGLGRQFAVHEQEGCLEESALFRELLDRVTAILENASIAIDISDAALARC